MRISDRWLNIEYALVQSFYWMGFCVCVSFATVFLQGRGYSNSSLGLVLALGNILGFLIAPNLASAVDGDGKVTVFHCLWAIIAAQLLLLISFTGIRSTGFGFSALYCLYMALNSAANSLNTQLCFELGGWTGRINYSATRGCGSIAYAPTALIVGYLAQRYGSDVIPYIGIALIFLQAAVLAVITIQTKSVTAEKPAALDSADSAKSLPEFFRTNPRFCVLLLGMCCLFFAFNLVFSFMINVVRNVGGDTAVMGGLSGFSAIMEIPVMLLYSVISRKIRCSSILRFSVLMFVIKLTLVAFAPSVGWLFATQVLKGLSFALLTLATVQYTSLVVGPRDSTKGQALSYGMTTLGSAFAGGIGGMMYDSMPVHTVLLIGAAISVIGAVICEIGIDSNKADQTLAVGRKKPDLG